MLEFKSIEIMHGSLPPRIAGRQEGAGIAASQTIFMESLLQKQPKRILLVDDEENARIALSLILSREGYIVDSVSNGFEALNHLREHDVNLIVTDINMPEMDGISFLREVNRCFPGSNVIMMTAYGGVESYIEAINLGAFEYINKPVKIEELKSIMNKIFQEAEN